MSMEVLGMTISVISLVKDALMHLEDIRLLEVLHCSFENTYRYTALSHTWGDTNASRASAAAPPQKRVQVDLTDLQQLSEALVALQEQCRTHNLPAGDLPIAPDLIKKQARQLAIMALKCQDTVLTMASAAGVFSRRNMMIHQRPCLCCRVAKLNAMDSLALIGDQLANFEVLLRAPRFTVSQDLLHDTFPNLMPTQSWPGGEEAWEKEAQDQNTKSRSCSSTVSLEWQPGDPSNELEMCPGLISDSGSCTSEGGGSDTTGTIRTRTPREIFIQSLANLIFSRINVPAAADNEALVSLEQASTVPWTTQSEHPDAGYYCKACDKIPPFEDLLVCMPIHPEECSDCEQAVVL